MPLMSGRMTGFGVEMTTTHGRAMIERQVGLMLMIHALVCLNRAFVVLCCDRAGVQRFLHDDMVGRAPTVVEDRVLPIYMRQMKILHEAERFKPSFNQMKAQQEEVLYASQRPQYIHNEWLQCRTL